MMTTRFRQHREQILDAGMQGRDILPLSETFNRQAIDALLAVPGCAGLRIYPGMDEDKKVHAIMVPVNEANEDMLPVSAASAAGADDPIVEMGQRCPFYCPPASKLNS
ncbi:MAG: hypothetical protein EOP51_23350 [Sphingobacteriales bacterium]|nr:MAG: hypothetical protein EOP51_23350 [Sphingobacteriales bacterium]